MKKKKRLLSILLSLALVLGLMPGMSLTAFADGAYSGGTGTKTDPYLISTVDDWKALAASVNGGEAYGGKYFRQTADLDMSGAGSLNPVGTLAVPFAGNYEGDGFAISNAAITGMACTVQGYNMNVAGLFGALVGGGSISNLRVTNVSATATSGSGGWDQAYAGGLVAYAEDCTITDCSVSGSTITAGNSNIFAGALAGFASAAGSEKTMFSKCASENNTVNTYDYGGGFIGAIVNETSSNDAILFTDCYSAKNTADAGTHNYGTVGGFLGGSQGGNVTVRNGFVYGCSAVANGTGSGKGVFTGDTTYGTVQASNTYYYDTQNLSVNADSATSKTVDEMKSLASTLGNAFSQGSNYPILLHPVNLEVSIEGWTYGEAAKKPSVTRNSSDGEVTYQYKVNGADDNTYSDTAPTGAGDYTVKATVAATTTHKAAEATADFTIAKVDAAVTTAPTAKTLTYNGQAQELVTAGTATGGEMQYALGTATEATQPYTTSIPTKTEAGTYYVWYKVVGNDDHNDTTPVCVTVEVIDRESAIKELEDLIDEYADTPLAEKIATIALRAERKIDKASKQKDISDILQNAKDAVLDAVKQSAKSEIEQYDPNDYLDNDKVGDTDKSSKQTVEAAKEAALATTGDNAIDAAKNKAEVQAALDAFNTAIENCKLTKAAEEEAAAALAAAKTTANNRLEDFSDAKALSNMTKAEKEAFDKAVAEGKAAIDAAKDVDAVNAALKKAKEDVSNVVAKIEKDRAAEAKAKSVKTVTVNVKTVNAKAIDKAVKKASGSNKYVTSIVLGKKVKKISKAAFKTYKKVKTLTVKTKKLKKKSVKGSLKGSKITKIKVKNGKKKTNKKYVKKYKKIFKKKNSGKKVKVS